MWRFNIQACNLRACNSHCRARTVGGRLMEDNAVPKIVHICRIGGRSDVRLFCIDVLSPHRDVGDCRQKKKADCPSVFCCRCLQCHCSQFLVSLCVAPGFYIIYTLPGQNANSKHYRMPNSQQTRAPARGSATSDRQHWYKQTNVSPVNSGFGAKEWISDITVAF